MATQYSIELDHNEAKNIISRLNTAKTFLESGKDDLVQLMNQLGSSWGGYARDQSMEHFSDWSKIEADQIENITKLIEKIDEYVMKMVSYDSEAMKG